MRGRSSIRISAGDGSLGCGSDIIVSTETRAKQQSGPETSDWEREIGWGRKKDVSSNPPVKSAHGQIYIFRLNTASLSDH